MFHWWALNSAGSQEAQVDPGKEACLWLQWQATCSLRKWLRVPIDRASTTPISALCRRRFVNPVTVVLTRPKGPVMLYDVRVASIQSMGLVIPSSRISKETWSIRLLIEDPTRPRYGMTSFWTANMSNDGMPNNPRSVSMYPNTIGGHILACRFS